MSDLFLVPVQPLHLPRQFLSVILGIVFFRFASPLGTPFFLDAFFTCHRRIPPSLDLQLGRVSYDVFLSTNLEGIPTPLPSGRWRGGLSLAVMRSFLMGPVRHGTCFPFHSCCVTSTPGGSSWLSFAVLPSICSWNHWSNSMLGPFYGDVCSSPVLRIGICSAGPFCRTQPAV